MKFFKIAVVTFLMLCSASTGAMAAIVEDYSGWRTSYQWVSSWENWTDTIDLSGLNLSQGDGLMIEVSFSGTNTWENWNFYANGETLGILETTGNWTDFNTQSFFLDAYDADTILLGLDDSYGDFSFMMLDAISFTRISSVPAPAAVWLFGSGLLGLVVFRRNRRI